MEDRRIKCCLQNFSPIHIGCDEVYEPTGFVVDRNNNCLKIFDPLLFIAKLSKHDREKFSGICKKGTIESILEIYKFLNNCPAQGRSVKICNGFVDHYNQVLKLPSGKIKNELNRFKIERTAFCIFDQRPYIPGSTVKGALRTAYLNSLADKDKDYSSYIENLNQRNTKNRRNRKPEIKMHKELEEKLLHLDRVSNKEKIYKDPFRLVKVSDFMPVGDIKTKICYAVNKKKKMSDSEARRLTQILETILPGSLFVGEIIVNDPQTKDAVSFAIELNNLLESSHLFYGKEKTREDSELKNIGVTIPETPEIDNIMLIRVGRHSGAESVTIERYRDIKIMLGSRNQTFKDHSTTIWLASELRKPDHNKVLSPFGWAALSPLTPDMEKQLKVDEAAFQSNRNQALVEEKRKQEELLLQKEQEWNRQLKDKKQEEEISKAKEQREAELEAMTPEQRVLAELGDPSILENRAVEIYNKIDEFSEENKRAIAMALKKYWASSEKLKKKKRKKTKAVCRQMDRIKKIEGILVES
jgi:CRISPR-associated protein Csm5